jgi:hypothetical protein
MSQEIMTRNSISIELGDIITLILVILIFIKVWGV